MLLHTRFDRVAAEMPEKVAVVQGQRRATYGEVARNATHIASFLTHSGVRKGDRVGILSENSPEYVSAYFGLQKAGAMAVDINHQSSPREIETILDHSEPAALIGETQFLNRIAAAVESSPSIHTLLAINSKAKPQAPELNAALTARARCLCYDALAHSDLKPCLYPDMCPDDVSTIIYTSGTTGDPKGVMLSHENLLANAESIIDYLHIAPDDSVMVILPFCYSYGKSLLTTHLLVGATLVLENSFLFPDVVLNKMIEEGVTGFAGVPSTFAILLNRSAMREYRFPDLRYVTQAGGAMPPQHAQELMKALPGVDVYIMYGQTEAGPRLTYLDPKDLIRKAGSIGKAIPGVTIELMKEGDVPAKPGEEGEIVASGRNIMLGYWNNPLDTAKVLRDGKLYTGDMAWMDEEGYLYIVGRRSDMIKSGAHRISPKEIEEVILELPQTHEVSVVGISDTMLGEAIKAFIVLKDGATLDDKEVQRHCRAKLAQFKVPKEVAFVGHLPKTNAGKVRRHLLKQR